MNSLAKRRVDRRRLGLVVAGLGIVIAAVSALVDELGFGTGGFGWKQTVGTAVGVGVAILGAAISATAMRARRSSIQRP